MNQTPDYITKKQAITFETNGYKYQGYWDGFYHYSRKEREGHQAAKYLAEHLLNGDATTLMLLDRTA